MTDFNAVSKNMRTVQMYEHFIIISTAKGVKCPECGSTYVIEMTHSHSPPSKQLEPIQMDKSNSHSSIGEEPGF